MIKTIASRLALLALAGSLLSPGFSSAGSINDPELIDPSGDAFHVSELGSVPAMDLLAVWFTTVRDGDTVTGYQVHVKTAAPVSSTEEHIGMQVVWTVRGTGCHGTLWMYGAGSDEVVENVQWGFPSDQADLDFVCSGEDGFVEVLDLATIRINGRSRPAGLQVSGDEWVATVPLAAFDEGDSSTIYGDGAVLTDLMAWSMSLNPTMGYSVDYAPDCIDPCGDGTYTIGS